MGNMRGWMSGSSVVTWKVYIHLREGSMMKGERKKNEWKVKEKWGLNRKGLSQRKGYEEGVRFSLMVLWVKLAKFSILHCDCRLNLHGCCRTCHLWRMQAVQGELSYPVFSPSSIPTLPLFEASLHLRLVPDSTPHESLISSYYHSSCVNLLLLLLFSVLSCHLCFVRHFNHLLFLFQSFLFLCTSSSFYILCMWLSFACDSFVTCYILSFPSITVACDISYLHFTPISIVMTTVLTSKHLILLSLSFLYSALCSNLLWSLQCISLWSLYILSSSTSLYPVSTQSLSCTPTFCPKSDSPVNSKTTVQQASVRGWRTLKEFKTIEQLLDC